MKRIFASFTSILLIVFTGGSSSGLWITLETLIDGSYDSATRPIHSVG